MVLVFLTVVSRALFALDTRELLSVYVQEDGTITTTSGQMDKAASAYGYFTDGLFENGWGILEIKTGTMGSNSQKLKAVGYLEGYLTAKHMWSQYQNMMLTPYWDFTNMTSELSDWFDKQQTWEEKMIEEYGASDPLWEFQSLLSEQFQGLGQGYNDRASQGGGMVVQNDTYMMTFLNSIGDLIDIENILIPESRPDYSKMKPEELEKFVLSRGRCSAMVHVSPRLDKLWAGHSAWFTFQAMNRIWKIYNFDIEMTSGSMSAKTMAFSSYPGLLSSLDDFYLMDNGVLLTQTTNNIFDHSLYDLATPESLYAWQRVQAANRLADDGKAWWEVFEKFNSGTYNNQYMVVNHKTFVPGEPLPDDLLWVIEQIPGTVAGEDMTEVLRRGYWGSYNVPALELIYNLSGYPEFVEKYGPTFSYDLAPRALLFRRDGLKPHDEVTFGKFLRYNNYRKDPLQDDNPGHAICSRGDLDKEKPSPSGCYDTKFSNLTMMRNLEALIQNGPTHDDLPPFQWGKSEEMDKYPHAGLPDKSNFGFIRVKPLL